MSPIKDNVMVDQTLYSTKVTRIKQKFHCRIFYSGVFVVEGIAETRIDIGPTFRDLFRTLDKLGGDKFTSAVRKRKYEEGNAVLSVKHFWNMGERHRVICN